MAFNGSGTFLINTAGQPVVSGTVISSTAFNALTADLATGLSTAITKDGQTTVTANIPMSTYKFTGLGVGSAATDSANLSQVQSTVTKLLNSVSGADTITATASPTLAAYAAGQMFYFVAAGDNTTSVTLNIDALGAKAVTRDGSTALVAADIKSGEVIVVVYDGTRFQVVSQLNSAGDARFANVSIASSLYVGGVSTFVGNAGFSANVSIASALSVGGVAAITGATTIGGNLTLSGGTANGVLYLNGSKVATSGSALTFDGTNFATTQNVSTDGTYTGTGALTSNGSNYLQWRYNDASGSSVMAMAKARGTSASPAAVQSGDELGRLSFDAWGGTTRRPLSRVNAGVEVFTSDSNISSNLTFHTSSSGAASATEKMRLDSSGQLGIGTTTNALTNVLTVYRTGSTQSAMAAGNSNTGLNGTLFGVDTAGNGIINQTQAFATIFSTNNTERARLTSGGNLLVGKASEFAQAFRFVAEANSSTTAVPGCFADPRTDAASAITVAFYRNGTKVGSVDTTDVATAYVTSSDRRLKDNIVSADDAGSVIDAIEVVKHDWKVGGHTRYGMIAQDLHMVAPEAVSVGDADDAEDFKNPWGVDYSKLVPMLVKEVQSLRKRVAELESK